ncbi:gas vesicle protein [Streptosporangium sp. NBC_01639]|uniref:gas vesicle protein n=1 Tax=Streptosporangium sp. NBC_01639 TaxID=2975948 RepID=UPI00386B9D8C|nr:gas vesicle protein [Streptosporangium sp. NBC_01639]
MPSSGSRGAALAAEGRLPSQRVALVDLLDRLLAGGVVVSGDIVLSIADIDLVRISLRLLIMSVRESGTIGWDTPAAREARHEPVWK